MTTLRHVRRTIIPGYRRLFVEDELVLEPVGRRLVCRQMVKAEEDIAPLPPTLRYNFAYAKHARGQVYWRQAEAEVVNRGLAWP